MIKTNKKMNETVKETLTMRGDNMSLYAVKRIEELEAQVKNNAVLPRVSKRYKIQGTSFTTNVKKWFEFDEKGWEEFKHRQWTHYPAWSFDSSTITEF
jgi:hypothetical protein